MPQRRQWYSLPQSSVHTRLFAATLDGPQKMLQERRESQVQPQGWTCARFVNRESSLPKQFQRICSLSCDLDLCFCAATATRDR